MLTYWCVTDKEGKLEKYLQKQDTTRVRRLLSTGANPNEYSQNGQCSFLSMAITQRNEALACALNAAAKYAEFVEENRDALRQVRMMLKAGASTNQTTWLGNESRHNSHSDEYPLHMAALQGHLGIVKALLEHGADVNIGQGSRVGTPLHLTAKQGHKELTSLLLNNGADIIAIDRCLDTPLHKAAAFGYLPVVQVLLKKGAPVNARNYNLCTPLHYAAKEGAPAAVKLLLESGADPLLKDNADRTAADLAVTEEIRSWLFGRSNKKTQPPVTSVFVDGEVDELAPPVVGDKDAMQMFRKPQTFSKHANEGLMGKWKSVQNIANWSDDEDALHTNCRHRRGRSLHQPKKKRHTSINSHPIVH